MNVIIIKIFYCDFRNFPYMEWFKKSWRLRWNFICDKDWIALKIIFFKSFERLVVLRILVDIYLLWKKLHLIYLHVFDLLPLFDLLSKLHLSLHFKSQSCWNLLSHNEWLIYEWFCVFEWNYWFWAADFPRKNIHIFINY